MIYHYLTVAFRNVLKYKAQNLISVIGLSVGLFCFCICFYISRFIGSVDECFENHKRLAEINLVSNDGQMLSGVPGKMLAFLREREWKEAEAFTTVSYLENKVLHLVTEEDEHLPYKVRRLEVDSLYHRMFTPTVIAGSWEQAAGQRNSIVMPERTARKMFGDASKALGRQMIQKTPMMNKQQEITYTIHAVIKDLPENTSMNFMQPVDVLTLNDDDGYEVIPLTVYNYRIYALLREGSTAKELHRAFEDNGFTFNDGTKDYAVQARPMQQNKDMATVSLIMQLVTTFIGLLVLLSASLNFFHFQTGSFLNRGREFSIRKILGNNTFGLFCLQFVQILIVILFATLVSGCMLELSVPFLRFSMFRFSIQMEKNELLTHLMQYMGILLVITAMVAAGIALYIRHANPQTSLHGYGKVNGKKRLRNTLLGIQFFICWLFVSITAALYLQAEKTSSSMFDTFTHSEKQEILCVPLNFNFLKPAEKQMIVTQLRQLSGVKDILLSGTQIISSTTTNLSEEPNNKKNKMVRMMTVSANFPSFMNLPLEGQVPQNDREIMVSKEFADKYPDGVIGKTFYNYRNSLTVTGVLDKLNNYVYNDGYGKADYGTIYFLADETSSLNHCLLKCHAGKKKEVLEQVEQIFQSTLPASLDYTINTLQEHIEEYQAMEHKLKDIVPFFAIVSLIITLLGVYSAITLDTERRQKEVAIRKINGAGIKEIIKLFARLYIVLLGVSALPAFPVVYLILQEWKQLYKVWFNDGILFWGGILLSITLITGLTVLYRILKIARINPATIIKKE